MALWACLRVTSLTPDQAIERQVDSHHYASENNLQFAREIARIYDRYQVAFNKALCIAHLAACAPERVFKRSKRAEPAHELDRGSPRRSGEVNPRHPTPAQREHTSQDRKCDKQKMDQNKQVGEGFEYHQAMRRRSGKRRRHGNLCGLSVVSGVMKNPPGKWVHPATLLPAFCR